MRKLTSIIALAILGTLSSVASAAPVETAEAQYLYCHWLAELNYSAAGGDLAGQDAYEFTFDYCDTMAPAEFAAASGVAMVPFCDEDTATVPGVTECE